MKKFILTLLLALCFQNPAYAGDENKIAAIVGGDIITTIDAHDRALMILHSGDNTTSPTTAMMQAAQSQALQMLIEETLYTQEAERLKLSVTPAELEHAIAGIEAKNQLQPGGFPAFLKERNIPASTVYNQVKAQILLAKIINTRVRPKVNVTERELGLEIARIGGNNRSLTLKQIFVPLGDTNAQDLRNLRQKLEHLRSNAKGCETFDTLAAREGPEFAPTVLNVTAANLNPAIRELVSQLDIGEPSNVLQTDDSLQLLMLCERGQPALSPTQKQQLSAILLERKVDLQTKQYLRTLRQETYVEVR